MSGDGYKIKVSSTGEDLPDGGRQYRGSYVIEDAQGRSGKPIELNAHFSSAEEAERAAQAAAAQVVEQQERAAGR